MTAGVTRLGPARDRRERRERTARGTGPRAAARRLAARARRTAWQAVVTGIPTAGHPAGATPRNGEAQ